MSLLFCCYHLILVMAESSFFLIKRQTWLTRDDFEEHLHLWGDAGSFSVRGNTFSSHDWVFVCLHMFRATWGGMRCGPWRTSVWHPNKSFRFQPEPPLHEMKSAAVWGLSWCRRAVLFLRRHHQTDKLSVKGRTRGPSRHSKLFAPEIPGLWSNLCFQSFWALKFGSFISDVARICCCHSCGSKGQNIQINLAPPGGGEQ